MRKLQASVLTLVLAAGLSSCGGGEDARTVDALEAVSVAPQRMRILAVPAGADAVLNAERLLDHGESDYKEFFPTKEPTRNLSGWAYRYYPQTGVFLAVINWRVFVVGGPFGPDVRDVGEVSDYITITSASNQAPTVSLAVSAGPAASAASIVLTATAADSDGTIAKVEFFSGTNKLGEDLVAPYVYTWSNVPAGLYELSAKATDDSGATTTASSSLLNVSAGVVAPPSATLSVAALAKCSTAFGSTDPNLYKCLVGSTPVGSQTLDITKACSMTVSDVGVIAVTSEGQSYSVSVPQLVAAQRYFTRTVNGVSFDYGSADTSLTGVRIKARTDDKVPGQFFQFGGALIVEVTRSVPAVDLSCTIQLPMT